MSLITETAEQTPRHRNPAIIVGLILLGLAAFWPVFQCDFVNFDDPDYVTSNGLVLNGLTRGGVTWAFTTPHAGNWHPLTWLSHMADVSLFGQSPAGPHGINLAFHLTNGVLLLLLLGRLTGKAWLSATVAALFLVHPLRVESVAWISERKDVLSLFFGLLSLLAYQAGGCRREAERPETGDRRGERPAPPASGLRPAADSLSLLFFALALMSKPMMVSLPAVMLLLDFWPLGRFAKGFRAAVLVVVEKIPFIMLGLASCVVTYLVQRAEGATHLTETLPFSARLANATVSYARYLGATVWPVNLTVFYEHPLRWPVVPVAGAAALLVITTVLTVLATLPKAPNSVAAGSRSVSFPFAPWLLTGWLWFLITLVPVIGVVQVGDAAIADRYLYLPGIGLMIMLVWTAAALIELRPAFRQPLAVLALVAIVVLTWRTNQQCRTWLSSETLFRQTLAVNPRSAMAHNLLGMALIENGKTGEAEGHFEAALQQRPDYFDAKVNLGIALGRQGKLAEAAERLKAAVAESPKDANAQFNLGSVLEQMGDQAAAAAHYLEAAKLRPDYPEALNNLAWIRATSARADLRDGETAVRLARQACELTAWRRAMFLGTLAAAYAEAGRFDDAVTMGERAINLARAEGASAIVVVERNQELLALYRKRQPYHEAK